MRKCFWAVAELLCLFAIRSDRQDSHIHHCHLPPDSVALSLPPPLPASSSEIAHFYQQLDISIISFIILRAFLLLSPSHSIFLSSSASASLAFQLIVYLCVFHPHLAQPRSDCTVFTCAIMSRGFIVFPTSAFLFIAARGRDFLGFSFLGDHVLKLIKFLFVAWLKKKRNH